MTVQTVFWHVYPLSAGNTSNSPYPDATSVDAKLIDSARTLADFVRHHAPVLVLTGAGISTGSGIPEYRDANGNWKHAKPVQYRDFLDSALVYRRYWARSAIGWQIMGNAQPNAAHFALAELETSGHVGHLITQNVDNLHSKAAHRNYTNLHGDLSTVSCQTCKDQHSRHDLQTRMQDQNPQWFTTHPTIETLQKPDGDADIPDSAYASFTPPLCAVCNGKLKPDVVFFGETIPQSTLLAAQAAQQQAAALLVVGSSLVVFSGFRIVRDFCQRQLPVAIINKGVTRADDLVARKYRHDAMHILPLTLAYLRQAA